MLVATVRWVNVVKVTPGTSGTSGHFLDAKMLHAQCTVRCEAKRFYVCQWYDLHCSCARLLLAFHIHIHTQCDLPTQVCIAVSWVIMSTKYIRKLCINQMFTLLIEGLATDTAMQTCVHRSRSHGIYSESK
jgi:hypothetical protein